MSGLMRRLARGIAKAGLAVAVFGLAVMLAADALNFPLLPLDLLRPLGSLDVTVRLPQIPAGQADWLLTDEGGARIQLVRPGGRPVRAAPATRTDTLGRVKLTVPRGRYRLVAEVSGLLGDTLERFATPADGIGVTVGRELQTVHLDLLRTEAADPADLAARLEAALREGAIEQAGDLAGQLAGMAAAQAERGRQVQRALAAMTGTLTELDGLPMDAYNRRIVALEEIAGLMQALLPEDVPRDEVRLRRPDETIYPISRVDALRRARNEVIRDHLVSFRAFRGDRNLNSVASGYLQWLRVRGSADLYDPADLLDPELTSDLMDAAREAEEDRSWLSQELPALLEQARGSYDGGELETAAEMVGLYLRHAPGLAEALAILPEDLELSRSLHRDIRLTLAGDRFFALGRFEAAEERYREVADPITRVRLRLEELGLLRASSSGPLEIR